MQLLLQELLTTMLIDILNKEDLYRFKRVIDEAKDAVLCCHVNPDGDAIGSCLAMAEYLRSLGKVTHVVVPDQYPDFLQWLPQANAIVRYDKHKDMVEDFLRTTDLLMCLDFNQASRTDSMADVITAASCHKVMIDHHLAPNMKTDLTVSHPELSSTCELVFRIVWQLGGFDSMGRNFATATYCGMMTDTGGFTYNSTRPEIYFIISQLLTKGIDKDKIYRNVYNTYSEKRMRLMGYVLYRSLVVDKERRAAYFTLTRKDLKRFHFIKGDAEGLVNLPLQIKGTKLSISLREDTERENLIWVSLRSVDNFPCNKMAETFFNGGGHLNASGGRLNCSMDEAVGVVKQALEHFESTLK